MRLRSICRALLALDLAWCAAGIALPDLPAWKMFDATASEPFAITAGDGRAIDARAWVPRGVPELDARDAVRIARWLCATGRAPAPLRIDARELRRVIDAPGCVPHAP